jgi:RNase H-fold protein (predicted Holliday junction resolvase)
MATLDKQHILALDPGRNIGVAYVDRWGRLRHAAIIDLGAVKTLDFSEVMVVVGNGTGSRAIQDVLQKLGVAFAVVDEEGTTLEGRTLYFRDHPPKGLMRYLPKGLWSPPRNIDDYAAYAIALRYLHSLAARDV